MPKALSPSNVPTVRYSGERLRELREARGLDIAVLAKRLTLSTAQLQQLEQNQGSLFYSEAIRLSAARKVADYFGEPLQLVMDPAVEAIDPPAALAEPSQAAPSTVEVTTARPESSTEVLAAEEEAVRPHRPGRSPMRFAASGWNTALGAVALSLVILIGLQNFGPDEVAVAAPAPQATAPEVLKVQLEVSQEPPAAGANLAAVSFAAPGGTTLVSETSVPVVPAGASPALAAASPPEQDCDSSSGPIGSFTPPRPVKDAGQVFVRGVQGQLVCVRDGKGQVWRHQFNNGSGRNFSGTAPWVVESAQLMDLEVYFQGARARASQPGTTRLKLIPGEPS